MAKTKTIEIGGQTYVVPEGYDPAVFSQQLDIEKQLKEQLDKAALVAEQAVPALEQQEAASVAELRRQAGRALAGSRGLAGGGRGLGLAREVGESAATAEGKIRGQFAEQISGARQQAATTALETMLQKGKLLEAEASRKAAGANADTRAKALIEQYKGTIFTTNEDKRRMVKALEKERDAAINPQAAATFQAYIDSINSGSYNVEGSIDLDF